MNKVKTKNGVFPIIGHSKIALLVFIDLMFSTVTLSFVIELVKLVTLNISPWIAAFFGILTFLYPLLAYRNVVKSVGRWSHGVGCYPCSELDAYSGKGVLWVEEGLSKKILSKRTLILITYFVILVLVLNAIKA